jgi:uncharacterized coiled-coil protein SlyX
VIFTPKSSVTRTSINVNATPVNGLHSLSAPSNLGSESYIHDLHLKQNFENRALIHSSTHSLWKVVHSQQQQINDVQRRLDELTNSMRDLKTTRIETPCISDAYGGISPLSSHNYRARRRDMKNPETSFVSEWDQVFRKSTGKFKAILPLPPPQDLSDSDPEDLETSRRIELLIRKYTN